MNVIDVYPKDVHASLELSIKEIAHILTFYDEARPLYNKVYGDSMDASGAYMEKEFIAKLRQVFENVQKGM